jgi:hypothetical protein
MAPPVSEKAATKPGNSADKGSCRQVTHPNQRQAFMDLADRSAGAARSRGYGPAVLFAKPVARHADDGTSWIQTAYEHHEPNNTDQTMPILLWLIGVPLSLVLLLMLAGVVHF